MCLTGQECRDLAASVHGNGCNSGNIECAFYVYYGSGANTSRVYSNDALTLGPGEVVQNFHFGCGHDQEGPFGRYDGVLGLGRLPSLVG